MRNKGEWIEWHVFTGQLASNFIMCSHSKNRDRVFKFIAECCKLILAIIYVINLLGLAIPRTVFDQRGEPHVDRHQGLSINTPICTRTTRICTGVFFHTQSFSNHPQSNDITRARSPAVNSATEAPSAPRASSDGHVDQRRPNPARSRRRPKLTHLQTVTTRHAQFAH